MVPAMVFYTFLPCVIQAASVTSVEKLVHVKSTTVPPTGTMTYFYGNTTPLNVKNDNKNTILMNAEDDNGNMSSYLSRTVRTIVNVKNKTVVDSQCLFTDGKNVISQTNNTGTKVTSTRQYNAFGVVVNDEKSANALKVNSHSLTIADNPFAYNGYYSDPESNLYYLNARYYSPTLMQFISMDTYDLANRYGYCNGNPIGNEDPSGHDFISKLFGFNNQSSRPLG